MNRVSTVGTAWVAPFVQAVVNADGYADPTVEVLRAVLAGLPAVDAAALTSTRSGKPRLRAAAGDIAARSEALQSQLGEGPTLDAFSTGTAVGSANLTADPRWPKLRDLGMRMPARAVLCCPLTHSHPRPVILTLYARGPAALKRLDHEMLSLVLVNADTALAGLAHHSRTRHLRRALTTNDQIGVAIGVLMVLHHRSEDDAYNMLATASHDLNRRISDIADEVVMTGALPERPLQSGDRGASR